MTISTSRVLAVAAAMLTSSYCLGQAGQSALTAIGRQAGNFGQNSIDQINQSTLNSAYRSGMVSTGVGGSFGGLPTNAAIDGQLRRTQRSAPRPTSTFNVGSIGTSSKPFANSTPDSTTSPYLNLFIGDDGNSDVNFVPYQSLVRPILNQQAFNQQTRSQEVAISRRVQEIAAQPAFNPQGSERQLPTGHSTVFGNTSHFFPQARGRR